ncbi:DUF4105 domain-containing protein [Rhodothermus bifroesti]|uniref:Lnb N-terminal periplasmic domain-containing protein n=1 Tax=Rhodothermus bifroesti TaxID=2823335 RepID=UPI001AEFC93E|nr:DUF4105 domain-containing protein [Rhodothermus bifroesti]
MRGLLIALLLVTTAQAQPLQLSDSARIALVTVLPGDALYAAFGHSALRVYDPVQNIDWLFNYGTFDFNDPWFLPRFVYGELNYFLSVSDYVRSVQFYREVEGRPIIAQWLHLTPAQRDTLFAFLLWNAQPENRTYRYDFLFDNCSTRIRDVLERTLGPALRFSHSAPQSTFRELLDPYVADRPLLQLGFYLTLGARVDRPPTAREVMFLPLELMYAVDQATVRLDSGWAPLVAQTDTLFWPPGHQPLPRPTWPWPVALGWILFAASALATVQAYRHRWAYPSRLDALLFGVVGLVGLVLLLLWVATLHTVTAWNWNLLWAWPPHLWIGLRCRQQPSLTSWERHYVLLTAALTLPLALGWPFWPQDLHPALQPIALLLVLRSAAQLWAPRTTLSLHPK